MMLRDELTRRGLNEAMTALRYLNPPDYFVVQSTVYSEERQEDQQEALARVPGVGAGHDVALAELIKLAQEHADLYPLLVDTVKKYIKIFDRQDLDERLRADLVTVLDTFLDHAAGLENFDDGWRVFMRRYLASIRPIVGEHAIVRSAKVSDTASVPTSFLQELEALREQVEELSDEVSHVTARDPPSLSSRECQSTHRTQRARLRVELNEQIAETNVLRALPVERSPDWPKKVSSRQASS